MSTVAAIERQLGELEEPEKPYPEDCCGGGCAPCIWDSYYEELEAFVSKKEQLLMAKAQLEQDNAGEKVKEPTDQAACGEGKSKDRSHQQTVDTGAKDLPSRSDRSVCDQLCQSASCTRLKGLSQRSQGILSII
jgi:hypothetical protein